MNGEMNIYYNEEGDYLEIFIKKAPNYGEELSSGITLFKDEETDEVIGIGILNFRQKAKQLHELELKLPFKVNFSVLAR